MQRVLFTLLFVMAAALPALAQDATKVDSKHYKIESENSRVRIVRVKYGPHEKSVMHTHPDLVAIFQSDGRVKFTYPNGKSEEREMKAGQVVFEKATRHLPENLSDNDMDVILVELKAPKRPAVKKAATTATAPNANKQ